MYRRANLITPFIMMLALSAVAADEVVDAGGCPVGESWAVPAEVVTVAGPAATAVPLIPDESMLECDVVVDCGVRFQEVLPLPAELGVAALDSLRFRVDESTPLSTTDKVNCWSVEVSLAVYPFAIDDVSPVFELNSTTPPELVYQGPVCLDVALDPSAPGLGEELVVAFDEPWIFDATAGALLVDVTVDGVAGYSGDVMLDAVDVPEVVTVVSLEGTDAPVGEVFPGGPVIIIDGVEGPEQPGDPRDCLAELDIPDTVRARLERSLEWAETAAGNGRPWQAELVMAAYHRLVDRYERRGTISSDAADKAHEYGSRAAGGFMGPYVLAEAFQDLAEIRPLLTLLEPGGLVVDQIPENSRAHELILTMDELMGEILLDGVVDSSDEEELGDWRLTYRRFMSEVRRYLERGARALLGEGWHLLNEFWKRYQNDPEFRFLVDLWLVAGDGVIFPNEAGALKDLRKQLLELMEGLDENNPLVKAFKNFPSILHQLAAKLEKEEIYAISVNLTEDGLGIFINTEEPVWIKVWQRNVPDDADYLAGKTITILVRVSNVGISWRSTENGHVIEVVADGEGNGLTANVSVTDFWTTLIWEYALGIDLDDLDINKITISGENNDTIVIEATSDEGEPVRIEVEDDKLKKVEVDGKQVYPEPEE